MKLIEFQKYLLLQNIDLSIFFHPDPILTYFTQKNFSYAFFLVTPTLAKLYITSLDFFPSLPSVTPKIISNGWEKEISSKKVKKLGIHKSALTVSQQEKLQTLFPNAAFLDVGKKMNELRQIKTTKETAKLSRACQITSDAFHALIQEFPKKKIKTELDVALFLESFMRRQGAELAFPTIVASGKNTCTPHHITSIEKLQKGFLQLDFGARWQNYCADMSRVIYLGVPSSEETKNYSFLLSVQKACIREACEGRQFKKLHHFAKKKLGVFSKYFIHSLGHGIGIEVHEAPVFKDAEARIKKGISFTIEPGIYFPEKYGLRIEDTVLWDGNTTKVLTKATKELVKISFPFS